MTVIPAASAAIPLSTAAGAAILHGGRVALAAAGTGVATVATAMGPGLAFGAAVLGAYAVYRLGLPLVDRIAERYPSTFKWEMAPSRKDKADHQQPEQTPAPEATPVEAGGLAKPVAESNYVITMTQDQLADAVQKHVSDALAPVLAQLTALAAANDTRPGGHIQAAE